MQGSQLYRQCFTQVRIIISDDGNVIWYPESGSSQQAVQINCRGIIETKERRCVSGKFEQLLIFRIKEDGIFVFVCKPEYSTGTGRQSSTVDSVYKSGVSHASRVFFTIHKADKRSMSTSYEVFSCQFTSLVIIGYNTWNIDKWNYISQRDTWYSICFNVAIQKLIGINVGTVRREKQNACIITVKSFFQQISLYFWTIIG